LHRIVWTRQARDDPDRIGEYIGQFAPLAAQRFALRLVMAVESLAQQSQRERPGPAGMRELTIIATYLIRYRVTDGDIEVLTIRHGARRPGG
jgi:toxin ParE1/3/4